MKKIIILERLNEPSDNSFRYLMWATVPASRIGAYANATATSAYKGAVAAEITAIQTGNVVEKIDTANYPAGTSQAVMAADLVTKFSTFQSQINNLNPTSLYGTNWDGLTWAVTGTA